MKKTLTIILASSFLFSLGFIFLAVIIAFTEQDPRWGAVVGTMFFVPVLALISAGIMSLIHSEFHFEFHP